MALKRVSYSFTRPGNATDYSANDLVANSATNTAVVPITLPVGKGGFKIHAIVLTKTDETDVALSDFDINFYCGDTAPTTTVGDNAGWTVAATEGDGYLGEWDLPIMVATKDVGWTTLRVGDTGMLEPICGYTKTGYLWAFLQADSAYVPASSEVFTTTIYYEHFPANS